MADKIQKERKARAKSTIMVLRAGVAAGTWTEENVDGATVAACEAILKQTVLEKLRDGGDFAIVTVRARRLMKIATVEKLEIS